MRRKYSMLLMNFFAAVLVATSASAKCSTSIKEAGEIASKILVEKAAFEKIKGITNFSSKLPNSTNSAIAGVSGYDDLYLVQVVDKTQQLNGVIKCDRGEDKLKILTLSWVSKSGNGVMTFSTN